MSGTLLASTITITLALILYTAGVWIARFQKTLRPYNLSFFWLGLCFDVTGTLLMTGLSQPSSISANWHGITGLLAILLMLFHSVWGTVGLVKKDERILASFKKFSILVWVVWLIPFVSGMIMGMGR